jgi:hypothetical protein
MDMLKKRRFWIFVGAINIALSIIASYSTIIQLHTWKINILHSKWILLLSAYAICILAGLFLILVAIRKNGHPVISFLEIERITSRVWKVAGGLLFLVSLFIYFPVRDGLFREFLPNLAPAIWVIWVASLLGSGGLKAALRRSWAESLAMSLVSEGILFQIIALLPGISTSPFSLNWSEGNNLYYASLINAKSLYGQTLPLSTLNPTYYLLRGIPFLVNGLPIAFHRLWDLILWLGITSITSALFARRLNLHDRMHYWLTTGWFFLFLLNGGPVRYELQVCVLLVLGGVSIKHPRRSLVTVIIASIWAGMSRLNWFPIPALLAIAIFILERPISTSKNLWDYLKQPMLWAVTGIGTAVAAQFLYILISGNGNNLKAFSTSLSSNLLWYRLLPNATYPLGILAGLLVFTLPVIAVIVLVLRKYRHTFHPLRVWGLGLMLLILLIGGSVVSVKIGGGSDLHNLDSFRILLALAAAYLIFGRAAWEQNVSPTIFEPSTIWAWLLLSLFTFVVWSTQPLLTKSTPPNIEALNNEAQALQRIVQKVSIKKKSILFVSQRQLLTFKVVDAKLIPDYDDIELTEMGMARNSQYLDRFYADIHQHHFDLIVTDIHTLNHREKDYPFGEENNLWIDSIYATLFCEYQPEVILEHASVQVMLPRITPLNCP